MVSDFEAELLRYLKALLKEQKITNDLMRSYFENQGMPDSLMAATLPKKKPIAEVIRRNWIKQ